MKPKDHPGVYIPPPLIYAAFFIGTIFLQRAMPLDTHLLHTSTAHIIAWIFIAFDALLAFTAIRQFAITKNTLITVKPANSLQTTGIYAITRNPMYLSLVCLYCGLALLVDNLWTLILLPALIIVIQQYVIRREERYLHSAFGEAYNAYTKKVRRWI